MARHFSSLCRPPFKSLLPPCRRPEAEWLGTGGGGRWRWGASLKGIITVSPEDVHNHSVKQTGVGREKRAYFHLSSSWSSLLPVSSTRLTVGGSSVAVLAARLIEWNHRKIVLRYFAVFALKFALDLSPLNGWVAPGPTYLCCRNPWVPSGCPTVWLLDLVSSEGNVELLRPGLAERQETGIN